MEPAAYEAGDISWDVIAIIALAITLLVGIVVFIFYIRKNGKNWIKSILATSIAIFLVSTVYLSIGAATHQLFLPKITKTFDPTLNGYYENIVN
jgi:multisubunit Na+/H+ antiporter MnhC subunit